ncbi:MAG: hypothetical protein ACI8UR_001841 [Natronomonas sp.]|jgi:hypothetical protein
MLLVAFLQHLRGADDHRGHDEHEDVLFEGDAGDVDACSEGDVEHADFERDPYERNGSTQICRASVSRTSLPSVVIGVPWPIHATPNGDDRSDRLMILSRTSPVS